MQRALLNRSLQNVGLQTVANRHRPLLAMLVKQTSANKQLQRYLATVEEVFPNKPDFASRHIGPRKTDVVTMLNSIGFKVIKSKSSHMANHRSFR